MGTDASDGRRAGSGTTRSECGCREGAIAVLAALLLLPILFQFGPPALRVFSWQGVALIVFLPVVFAAAGKIFGLARARLARERGRIAQPGASR